MVYHKKDKKNPEGMLFVSAQIISELFQKIMHYLVGFSWELKSQSLPAGNASGRASFAFT